MTRFDEFTIIHRLFAPLAAGFPGAFGLADDAALIRPPKGHGLVVTSDGMVEGVHFLSGESPRRLARRLLRVNLSDLAAMGARPYVYMLNLALPRGVSYAWLRSFAGGLAEEQREFGLSLIGGDTDATPGPLSLAATVFGLARGDHILRRKGARVGDDIYVSGTIGDAGLGLACLQRRLECSAADRRYLVGRFLLPTPRLALGQGLIGRASAAIDVSDGLLADLGHLCRASGVGAEISLAQVPFSAAARRAVRNDQPSLLNLLGAGEDYELVFTAGRDARSALARLAIRSGTPMTRIGGIRRGRGVVLLDPLGREISIRHAGYRHFGQIAQGRVRRHGRGERRKN